MSVKNGYDAETAGEIIAEFGGRPEMLVQILASIVERIGYVSEDGIRQLAEALNLSRADVHGVVSYYPRLSHQPARPPRRKNLSGRSLSGDG